MWRKNPDYAVEEICRIYLVDWLGATGKLSAISASFAATSALENIFNAEIAEFYAEIAEKDSRLELIRNTI